SHRIAIIEDEDVLRELLEEKFKLEGYDVITAADGEAGLALIRNAKPEVVLLDIVMPKRNGYDVLKALKADPSPMPKVIIISNSGQPVEIDKAIGFGARDFIVKAQIEPADVVLKVQKLLAEESSPVLADTKSHPVTPRTSPIPEGIRLLLVEDDQFLRDLMHTKLSRENFSVTVAVDGNQGLQHIQAERPDIVLLDVILPGIDGFRVLEMVRKDHDPLIAKTPIILLSNLGQDSDVAKGKELGATDYLIKSNLTIDEIIAKVRTVLGKS
ncbi:MAG: response regulator, partial [Patescibacteria group bacterium]